MQVTTAGYNKGIIRLMTKTPFVVEGILRDHCYLDGAYHDSIVWGLLRDEHYASLKPSADNRVLAVGLEDFVDGDDKAQARAVLAEHLTTTGRTALAEFLADASAHHDEATPGAAARADEPDATARTDEPVPAAAAPARGAA